MEYGRFPLDLYRVWDTKRKWYVSGMVGSRSHVRSMLSDYLVNYSGEKRRNYRVVPIQVQVRYSVTEGRLTFDEVK